MHFAAMRFGNTSKWPRSQEVRYFVRGYVSEEDREG